MPYPKTKDNRNTQGADIVTEVVKVDDVSPSKEVKIVGEYEIALPVHIKIADAKGGIVVDEPSKEVYVPRNWNKYFYAKGDWPAYTRDSAFTAVMAILQKKAGKAVEKDFSMNSLIGQEFDACVVRKGDHLFIDWVKTFQVNDVRVPSINELVSPEDKKVLDSVEPTEKAGTKADLEDLPF